jgi:hypothetical protein
LLESHGGLRCNYEAGKGKTLQEAVMSKRRQADHQNKIVMNFERDLFMVVGMILIEERAIVIFGALCDPRRSSLALPLSTNSLNVDVNQPAQGVAR